MFYPNSYPLQKLNRTVFGPQDKNFLPSSSHATEHSSKCDKRLLVGFLLGHRFRGPTAPLMLITCQEQKASEYQECSLRSRTD